MSTAADRAILLRLGTRVALLGSLLVVAVWLAAVWGWQQDRQAQLSEARIALGRTTAEAVLARLARELSRPLVSLDQSLIAARAQAAELEALRETRRGRRLVEEPELDELVRRQLALVLDELGAVQAAWLRRGSLMTWAPRGRPRLDSEAPLDGPCLVQQAGHLRLSRCRELSFGEGEGTTVAGAALDVLLNAEGARPGPVAWGLFVAGPGAQTLAFEAGIDPRGGSLQPPIFPLARPAFETWARASGWGLSSTELRGEGLLLLVATAPEFSLAARRLLVGDAGPISSQWRSWALRTGGVASTGLLFFCFLGWRINAAFRPVVRAARSLGAEDLDVQVPVKRSDEIGAIAAVLNDLGTSLKHARRNWEREAKLAAWRDVARGLAHEIKNPLTPIRGTVENLLRWRREEPARFDEKVESRLGTILEEVEQLSRLASAFSDFARLAPAKREPGDLNALLRGVAELQLADRETLRVEDRLDEGLPRLSLDALQMRQVATNLMKNAREALGEGGGVVRLESGRLGAGAWFAVSDDGPGVDEKNLDQLFVPGWSTRKQEGGSGLGLWLCHRIVLEHGGGIEGSRSQLGGLRIRVTLPEG